MLLASFVFAGRLGDRRTRIAAKDQVNCVIVNQHALPRLERAARSGERHIRRVAQPLLQVAQAYEE